MKKKKTPKRRKTARIDAAALIDALEQHVLGNRKMTSTQVNAALALLKKVMPDDAAREKPRHEEALRELE